MTARALVAGPGAMRALRSGARGQVEVAFTDGGYVRLGDDGWVLVGGPRAIAGPLSLLVAGFGAPFPAAGAPAGVEDGALVIGGRRIDHRGARAASAPRAPERAPSDAVAAALTAAVSVAGPPAAELRPGLAELRGGRLRHAAGLLAGRGPGLTPAGDDVLAGYAGWAASNGGAPALSPLAAGRASPIGLAYLRCAERGELPEPAAATIAAILAGDQVAAARRARVLLRWGASSGRALLWGIGARGL